MVDELVVISSTDDFISDSPVLGVAKLCESEA